PDGSHAAFVATGVLTTEANPTTGQSAAQGADNLYVYDAESGLTKFVASLCSGSEESGSLTDPACPVSVQSAREAAIAASTFSSCRPVPPQRPLFPLRRFWPSHPG